MMNSKKINRLIKRWAAEVLTEEAQPEPYDVETDTFAPGPRDRVNTAPICPRCKIPIRQENIPSGKFSYYCTACGTDWGKSLKEGKNASTLIKECVLDVLKEDLTTPIKNSLVLTPTGQTDEWSRPVYTDQDGKIYVDVNLGQGEPSIHSVTDEGEPDMPVRNYTIGQGNQPTLRKALCPRCKNSKPELMTRLPDGKQSCTSCHWEENPGEPAIAEGFDPTSAGPNPAATEETQYNPYPQWNAEMRKMEEDVSDLNHPSFVFLDFINKNVEFEVSCSTIEQAYEEVEKMFSDMAEDHGDDDLMGYRIVNKHPDWWLIKNSGTGGTYILFNKNSTSSTIQKLKLKLNLKESDPHGRYAQDASAGQFDPRTFGDLKKDPLSNKLAGIDDKADQKKAVQTAKSYLKMLRNQAIK